MRVSYRRGAAAAAMLALVCAAPGQARRPPSYPFQAPDSLRAPDRSDRLPSLFADGSSCATGCRAPGALPGWPVRPFHRPHLLGAGLNERRPSNMHSGVDIIAADGSPVYAVEPGVAEVLESSGPDARVRVGRFEYWHIQPQVADGQYVGAYAQALGTVLPGKAHVHLSELLGERYLNPLRPGGRVLAPWSDETPPVLGRPRFRSGGRVLIRGFDPQSLHRKGHASPVLGLAALAYRLLDRHGRRVGPLRWALRGTQRLPDADRTLLYAPGAHPAYAGCSTRLRKPCRPNWDYRLAGGLGPALRLRAGRSYTLVAYAWDWAGNTRALETDLKLVGGRVRLKRRLAEFRTK